ncbi:L-type lectin-domain containing receptor kinase IX.1-like [Papaver somniferum]|uniref:L-type lectin-domain containing receptor kinase IX.1-like n=1 Tax=Papaver somniferum TaxID=3469 RepID=UPI000E6FF11C|nr:L-type lectin-domain containing receptor kinase IX.1-like [Papaver somniferum]
MIFLLVHACILPNTGLKQSPVMALYNTLLSNAHLHFSIFLFIGTILSVFPNTTAKPISFAFPSTPNKDNELIHLQGDSVLADNTIQLTINATTGSVGRATYSKRIKMWDATTKTVADFSTHFSFVVDTKNNTNSNHVDGIAFFLMPYPSEIPPDLGGGYLGLMSSNITQSDQQIVVVEFDTYQNSWDTSPDHVGININNSIMSVASESLYTNSMKNGAIANASISYNSTTKILDVTLTYNHSTGTISASLHHNVDLRTVLPENIRVGFSAASTGTVFSCQKILSWEFRSNIQKRSRVLSSELIVGLIVGLDVFGCLIGFTIFIWWRRKRRLARKSDLDAANSDGAMDDAFEEGAGPKRFLYSELVYATNNFHEAGKLGEGGFGGVYRGFLSGIGLDIAVKRISKGSQQGKREYQSEVRIISQLRHRNLVQLLGWSHERNELLLVYEFMPNQSLDKHLFCGVNVLTWDVRYKIALGLASALLYLHELWEQCVLHRDIKASNVMLDSDYNAKLGDFGLARLVDHQLGSQTTVLAGTMGYLAPECIYTSKSSKESDVYSFGIVALEIACGRKPVEQNKENLVDCVWELYANGKIVEAADGRLNMDFDMQQMERLLVLGLWCAHPDPTTRPTIRQVKNLLNYESSLVNLPTKLPSPVYDYAPRLQMCKLAFASSCGDYSHSQTNGSQCRCSSCSNAGLSQSSTKPSFYSSSSDSLVHSCKI